MSKICVFCGSSFGINPEFTKAARNLGEVLAFRKHILVYGGANVGLMGVLADAVLQNGGHVIGVMPKALAIRETAHKEIQDLRYVTSLAERKQVMINESDAFITMPGGLGTLDEWSEIMTWAQLGIHDKPMGLLNIDGFFDGLIMQMKMGISEGLISSQDYSRLLVSDSLSSLLESIESRL